MNRITFRRHLDVHDYFCWLMSADGRLTNFVASGLNIFQVSGIVKYVISLKIRTSTLHDTT